MATFNPAFDTYIAQAPAFAQPILSHLRDLVHRAVPDAEEIIKWRAPHFDCKGPLCNMAAFKQHCAFGFWKAKLMEDPQGLLGENAGTAMGQFGRITSLADLPPDEVIIAYLHQAATLNEAGLKVAKKPVDRTNLVVPQELLDALAQHPAAMAVFEAFSYTHKKDYAEWISEAKTEATKQKRIETAIEQLAEGKTRHWKYQKG